MTLPAQIQKQVDEAKAIIEQRYGKKAEEAESDVAVAEAEPVEDSAPPVEAEAPAPAASAPEPAAPTERVTPQDTDENSDSYAQRWRSLQGVYNATKRQLDESQQRIANLEQLFSQMQAEQVDSSIPKASKHITDKDVTEYGVDMVEFARRVSREEVAPLAQAVKMLMSKIDQLQGVVPVVQNVAAAQAKTAHEMFYDALTQRVPDWRTVNENVKFHDWLLSNDPLSGLQRQTLLSDAHNNLDVERVVNIFEMGKQALGFKPQAKQAEAVAAVKAAATSKLEKQIAPGRASAGSAPPQPKEAKVWSRAEISQFYSDKMRGVYKGREAEAQSLERDLFNAQREGRIA